MFDTREQREDVITEAISEPKGKNGNKPSPTPKTTKSVRQEKDGCITIIMLKL